MRSRLIVLPLAVLMACGGSSDSTSPTQPPPVGGGGGGTPTPVATTSVELKNFAFTPTAIKVAPSATVTWTNSDNIAHNVTFDGGAITGSGNFSTGSKSLVMPATAGTYAYKCSIHPAMTGTVQVQ
ncbi:MAG TPA: plastocyanin/azurin family copper-binding protein [Gemmatimonadaceae bacterium]|jgi:plastocyanin|nr:plastocyanin/azurin family copper-binding protein [Gemmatimonadaceae bacterium]